MAHIKFFESYIHLRREGVTGHNVENLALACFLSGERAFTELIPHIRKVAYPGIFHDLLKIEVPKYFSNEYYKQLSYRDYEGRIPRKHGPPLWTILMFDPTHFASFEFIINNWHLCYETKYDLINEMLSFLLYEFNGGFHESNGRSRYIPLPIEGKAYRLLINLLKENNGIRRINDMQQHYIDQHACDYNILKLLVMELDSNHEYQILEPYHFLSKFVDDSVLFQNIFNAYCSDVKPNSEYSSLLMFCLGKEFYDSYLILYNAGIKLKKIYWYSESIINLNNEVNLLYTIRHLLPMKIDPVEIQLICNNIVYCIMGGSERFKHIKVINDILEYNFEVSNQEK